MGTRIKIIVPVVKPIIPLLLVTMNELQFGFPQKGVISIDRLRRTTIKSLFDNNLMGSSNFKFELSEGQEIEVVNLISFFNLDAPISQNIGFSLIHWHYFDLEYHFLVNDVLGIQSLNVDYEDPFVQNISYLSGVAPLGVDELLLIVQPTSFIDQGGSMFES